jgi:hypothetical protein
MPPDPSPHFPQAAAALRPNPSSLARCRCFSRSHLGPPLHHLFAAARHRLTVPGAPRGGEEASRPLFLSPSRSSAPARQPPTRRAAPRRWPPPTAVLTPPQVANSFPRAVRYLPDQTRGQPVAGNARSRNSGEAPPLTAVPASPPCATRPLDL